MLSLLPSWKWKHSKNNQQRVSNYEKYVDTVNYDGIELPVSLKQVPKFEDQNNIWR